MLPGNMFSAPPDAAFEAWVQMRDTPFLSAQPFLKEWKWSIVEAGAGTVVLLAVVLWLTKCHPIGFFCFSRMGLNEHGAVLTNDNMTTAISILDIDLKAARILAAWALLACAVLVPVFITGANFFECGKSWLYPTIAYLADSPAQEWAVAGVSPSSFRMYNP